MFEFSRQNCDLMLALQARYFSEFRNNGNKICCILSRDILFYKSLRFCVIILRRGMAACASLPCSLAQGTDETLRLSRDTLLYECSLFVRDIYVGKVEMKKKKKKKQKNKGLECPVAGLKK
jgi:hypothetical protein